MQITEEVTEKFYNNCSERFKEIPLKTSVVVYFTLILPKKSTPAWTAASDIIWEVVVMVFFCADAVAQKC